MTGPHPNAETSLLYDFEKWLPEFGVTLRWWQRLVACRLLEVDAEGNLVWWQAIISTARQSGKALHVETPILTTTGWKTMGDLVAGDAVYAPDGATTDVVVAHPVEHLPAYRVTLTDGRSLLASGQHLWEVWYYQRRRVMTTDELRASVLSQPHRSRVGTKWYETREYLYRVSDQQPIKSLDVDLPFDPYVLGAWLGDGNSKSPAITVHQDDLPHLLAAIERAGYFVSSRLQTTPTTWLVRFSTSDQRSRRLANAADGSHCYSDHAGRRLRSLGVLGDKHIPDQYMAAGYDQRLALLRGLMDTDGSASATSTSVEFCAVNERLARDVMALARSLGFQARIKEGEARIYGRYISQRWRVCWSVHRDDSNPFLMPRKADRVRRTKWRKRPSIASIEPVGSREVRCITVDRPDGMFLAGRDLVPTHNSTLLRCLLLWMVQQESRWHDVRDCLYISKDEVAAKEILRPAQLWVKRKKPPDWTVKEANGAADVAYQDNRWMVRSALSVYGYTAGTVCADEAWKLRPSIIEEGLEPLLVERSNAMLLLVSTAHRQATVLMRSRRRQAIADIDAPKRSLILEWSADPDLPLDDERAHRQASPHWSDRRQAMVAEKARAALAGEGGDDFEPDPVEFMKAQWLNIWPDDPKPKAPGKPVVDEAAWAALRVPGLHVPSSGVVAAMEASVGLAPAIAAAWRAEDGRIHVIGRSVPSLEAAWAGLGSMPPGTQIICGLTWRKEQQAANLGAIGYGQFETARALPLVADMVTASTLAWDGDDLGAQMTALRAVDAPSGTGQSLVKSATQTHIARAAAWAILLASQQPVAPMIW